MRDRSYYSLERLWAEAPHLELPEMEGIPILESDEVFDEDEIVLGLITAIVKDNPEEIILKYSCLTDIFVSN